MQDLRFFRGDFGNLAVNLFDDCRFLILRSGCFVSCGEDKEEHQSGANEDACGFVDFLSCDDDEGEDEDCRRRPEFECGGSLRGGCQDGNGHTKQVQHNESASKNIGYELDVGDDAEQFAVGSDHKQ